MKTFVISILILQLTLNSIFSGQFLESAKAADSYGEILPAPDETLPPIKSSVLLTEQYHYVYQPSPDGNVDEVAKRILLSQIETANPSVNVNDFFHEVRVVYDSNLKTLSFQKIIFDKKLKRDRITNAHVFENVDMASNVAINGGEGYFEESGFIRAFLVPHLKASFCKKPLVTPVVFPQHTQGLRVTKIEFQSPELVPDDRYYAAADGELKFTFSDRTTDYAPRNEGIRNLASGLLATLFLVQIKNPELDQMKPIQKILQQNAAYLSRYMEVNRRLLESSSNDAVTHALRAVGQKLNFNEIAGLLEKDSSGKNEIDHLLDSPRNTYSYETWVKQYETISSEHQKDLAAGRPPRPWRQILVDETRRIDPELAALSAKAEAAQSKRMVDRIISTFNRAVTPRRLALTVSAIAALGVNYMFANAPVEWLFWVTTQVLNASTRVPVLNQITGPLVGSMSFFGDPPTKWALARLAFGASLIWAFNPLSYVLSKLDGIRKGSVQGARNVWAKIKNTDGVQAFFTLGTRAYGALNYPAPALVYNIARQKGLYDLMTDGNVEPLKFPAVFNSPFASNAQINKKYEKLNEQLNTDAAIRGRAALLAAAIVSEANSQNGNQIDIATLIMAAQGEPIPYFEDLMENAVKNSRWSEVTATVYRGLIGIGDTGGDIKQDELRRYLELYQGIADQFRHQSTRSLSYKLSNLYWRSKSVMSKKVLPFLLFEKQLYSVSRRYRKADVPPETKEIAKHAYDEDYRFSTYFYAGTDPKKFADIALGGIGAPEVIANQLSQVFIYGVQGAVDPPDVTIRLTNPFEPLSTQLYAGQGEHQESVKASLKNLVKQAANPKAPSYAGQHASVMQKLVEGFQVRFAADYLTRIGGVMIIAAMVGAERPLVETLWTTSLLSTYFLLAKVSFQVTNGTFVPGYATIWPYIQMAMTHLQGDAGKNVADLRLADHMMTTALDLNDYGMMRQAVDLLKTLYQRGGKPVPAQFNIPTDDYDFELAKQFHEDRLREAPVATRISQPIAKWFNRFGALSSTALFTSVSAVVYEFAKNPDASAEALLVRTLIWFGGTFLTMKAIQKTTPILLRPFRKKEKPNIPFKVNPDACGPTLTGN